MRARRTGLVPATLSANLEATSSSWEPQTVVVAPPFALQIVDTTCATDGVYWFCKDCERPTSEDYAQHMLQKHLYLTRGELPAPLTAADLLHAVRKAPSPAVTAYTMETPLYREANKAMREWQTDPAAFEPWRPFSFLVDYELRLLPRFEGSVYRAIDFQVRWAPPHGE